MKNLESMNLTELSINEKNDVNGGGILAEWLGNAAGVLAAAAEAYGEAYQRHLDAGGSYATWKN